MLPQFVCYSSSYVTAFTVRGCQSVFTVHIRAKRRCQDHASAGLKDEKSCRVLKTSRIRLVHSHFSGTVFDLYKERIGIFLSRDVHVGEIPLFERSAPAKVLGLKDSTFIVKCLTSKLPHPRHLKRLFHYSEHN